ncbi:G4 quadruplex nucleic acid binding protein [Loxospora ochrophaea]|nr:G4 quadruplex nucleic acid binding protein [Loxospora ochrophaea]
MAVSQSSSTSLPAILRQFRPGSIPSATSDAEYTRQASSIMFPDTHYNDNEQIEIGQWLTTSTRLATTDEDEAKHAERLGSLNIHLSTRTTLLGSKPSVADIALYARLAPSIKQWTPEERTGEKGYHHIVRYIDFVQNAPLFGLKISEEEKVAIDVNDVKYVLKPIDPKEEKERKKKEKEEALVAGRNAGEKEVVVGQGRSDKSKKAQAKDAPQHAEEKVKSAPSSDAPQTKKEKKEKGPKPQKQPPKETPLSPCLIDLRVGHILKAVNHPNADSLYVSTIACGDPPGTDNTSEHEGQVVRTVCSGLNGLVPLEEMQGRKIVAVCNLKPVTMRGVKSAAMVLAASPRVAEGEDSHAGPVELVSPPGEAKAGERIFFEGWEGEPEGVLNPKKKVWETIQPGFTTTDGLEVGFDVNAVEQLKGEANAGKPTVGKLVTVGGGICIVRSLKGATVR